MAFKKDYPIRTMCNETMKRNEKCAALFNLHIYPNEKLIFSFDSENDLTPDIVTKKYICLSFVL